MSPRRARILATVGVWIVRALVSTVRIRVNDRTGATTNGSVRPIIWAFWHNRLLLIPFVFRKYFPAARGAALTSLSKDGEILAAYINRFRIEAVRGSTSRGGAAALVSLKRALEQGAIVAVTPDGPRGPRYHLQPGLLKLAQLAETPIMPVHINYSRAWRLKSWDGFLIPQPFSRAEVIFDSEWRIARDESAEALDTRRQALEERMRTAAGDAGAVVARTSADGVDRHTSDSPPHHDTR
jgi:lysophospholipid acyltransferase (LPLAT)-like uncharacterized protein